jgi:hypothetical protein
VNTHPAWPRRRPVLLLIEWKRKALAMLLLCCLLPAVFAQTTPESASEEAVKAAFIYRFLNYLEWPPGALANADTPYVIGIADDEDVADELQAIVAHRKVNNRSIVLKRLRGGDDIAGLHILFIGSSDKARQAAWIKSAQQQAVLIVTETAGALEQGSMINFVIVDQRVRFEASLAAIERARLKVNSRMLAVAVAVAVQKETP